MKKSIVLLIAATLILLSCARVFYTSDARYLANTQKIIAIVPQIIHSQNQFLRVLQLHWQFLQDGGRRQMRQLLLCQSTIIVQKR